MNDFLLTPIFYKLRLIFVLFSGILSSHFFLLFATSPWIDIANEIVQLPIIILSVFSIVRSAAVGRFSLDSGLRLSLVLYCVFFLLSDLLNSGILKHDTYLRLYPILYAIALSWALGGLDRRFATQCLIIIVVVTLGLELLVIVGQFSGFLRNRNPEYAVGGTFGHPGFTSCLLALLLSSISFFYRGTFLGRGGVLTLLAAVLVVAIGFGSRTAVMICIFTAGAYFYSVNNWYDKRTITYGFLIGFLLSALFLSIYFKQMSSFGRMYIWRNCAEMIAKKPFFGYGSGSFVREYNFYQTQALKLRPDSMAAYLAERVPMAYNDFIEITVESGVVGLICLLAIFASIIAEYRQFEWSVNGNSGYALFVFFSFVIAMLSWSFLKILPFSLLFCTFLVYARSPSSSPEIL